jgi:DNA polymerase III gamma/tau subunit
MATSLATKYRPKALKDFLGNEDVTKALRSMMERDEIPHSLLFTGPSGCGKTTLARIVASRLKCSQYDFTENNAADFRGIDSVRDILRQMTLSPMNGTCRVWLLDECHQLSKDAQHALLKALEDTPTHVYFLLATTEPEKLLPTIKTRCVTFDVQPLSDNDMTVLLDIVVDKELGTPLRKEITDQIVQDSLGSARMALSILDKIINMDVGDMLATAKQQAAQQNEAIDLCRALIGKRPWKEIARIIQGITQEPESVRRAVLGYASAVLLKSGQPQAYLVLDAFRQDFFTTGKAGLMMAAYAAVS